MNFKQHTLPNGLQVIAELNPSVLSVAAGFFVREGFAEVAPESLPAAKWEGYAPERRRRVRAFRQDLQA